MAQPVKVLVVCEDSMLEDLSPIPRKHVREKKKN